MAERMSYMSLLEKWCKLIKPKRILEWGPGDSTLFMRNWCPDAEITTVEHLEWYYNDWKKRMQKNNIKTLFFKGTEKIAPDKYCNPPLKGKFDLIFVDGRRRVDCLYTAAKHIYKFGVVILHDSERPEYNEGKNIFEIIEERDGTCVMKLP